MTILNVLRMPSAIREGAFASPVLQKLLLKNVNWGLERNAVQITDATVPTFILCALMVIALGMNYNSNIRYIKNPN